MSSINVHVRFWISHGFLIHCHLVKSSKDTPVPGFSFFVHASMACPSPPSTVTAGHFLPTFCPARYIAVSANMFLKSSSFHRKYHLPLLSPGISAPSILLKYQYVFLFLPHIILDVSQLLNMFFDIVSVICSSPIIL